MGKSPSKKILCIPIKMAIWGVYRIYTPFSDTSILRNDKKVNSSGSLPCAWSFTRGIDRTALATASKPKKDTGSTWSRFNPIHYWSIFQRTIARLNIAVQYAILVATLPRAQGKEHRGGKKNSCAEGMCSVGQAKRATGCLGSLRPN